jgi:ABC-type transport system substrate-binding protein/class 3 adenylate cyclase/streptogramin lyase
MAGVHSPRPRRGEGVVNEPGRATEQDEGDRPGDRVPADARYGAAGPAHGAEDALPDADGAAPRAGDAGPVLATPAIPGASSEAELRTFLIADIRGYTTYTREHGDEAAAALAGRFAELVAEVVTAREGFLLEVRGDEALIVFASARRALRAAVDLQARFADAQLPRGVGIGLDAGEAIPVGDGYRGTALNLAARLCAQARAGETLASEAVIHLAAKMDGIAYVDPRSLKLKGYEDAVRAVVVVPATEAKGRRLATGHGSHGRDRRGYAAAAVAVMVVALLAGILGTGLLGRSVPAPSASPAAAAGPSASPAGSPDPLGGATLPTLAFFDAASGDLKATTPLTAPTNISLYRDDSFWILGQNPDAFNRIDPATHTVVQSIAIPTVEARSFTVDADSLWIVDGAGPDLLRIDQRTGFRTTIPLGASADDEMPGSDVAVGAGSVWVSRIGDTSEIVRLDPDTGEVQARITDIEPGTLNFGEDALWYSTGDRLGRIDPVTNAPSFDPVLLSPDFGLGNIHFGGGDAWVAESSTGKVWRVDRGGRQTEFTLAPGVGELSATEDTMWATNVNTGVVTGIDLVTGDLRGIDTGHATQAIAAGGGEIMVAVGPTVDEMIAGLDGSVLTIAVSGTPWTNPSPDPAMNWSPHVRQVLYLTCVGLVNYPDEPAPGGWELEPEVAAEMPTISPDGRTYMFTIKPGFAFSPPSNEPVTAETFRATIERALSPILDDGMPGPSFFGDIIGAKEYRAGTADHVSGLVASGDQLSVTLEAPAPDFLSRLALSVACPVPARTPVLLSGLDPNPPVGGAGPYYVAAAGRHSYIMPRLIVLKKNPNYHGSRPQPFDNIAIRTKGSTATSVSKVLAGDLDATMLDGGERISGWGGALADDWGPGSAHAVAGDQRWFGAATFSTNYLALNPSRSAFSDPDVRRAVSLALDRVTIGDIWVIAPSSELLPPGVPGSVDAAVVASPPDLEAARTLMNGRKYTVTMMGFPAEWQCAECRAIETAVTGQLGAIGITVRVIHAADYPADAFAAESTADLVSLGTGTDLPDAAALLDGLHEDLWLGEANLRELDRLGGLSGQPRIDDSAAFAHRIAAEESLVVPVGYGVEPFFISERIGCAFVQPAIAAVDLLSLCLDDGAAASPSPNPGPSTSP